MSGKLFIELLHRQFMFSFLRMKLRFDFYYPLECEIRKLVRNMEIQMCLCKYDGPIVLGTDPMPAKVCFKFEMN